MILRGQMWEVEEVSQAVNISSRRPSLDFDLHVWNTGLPLGICGTREMGRDGQWIKCMKQAYTCIHNALIKGI